MDWFSKQLDQLEVAIKDGKVDRVKEILDLHLKRPSEERVRSSLWEAAHAMHRYFLWLHEVETVARKRPAVIQAERHPQKALVLTAVTNMRNDVKAFERILGDLEKKTSKKG